MFESEPWKNLILSLSKDEVFVSTQNVDRPCRRAWPALMWGKGRGQGAPLGSHSAPVLMPAHHPWRNSEESAVERSAKRQNSEVDEAT